MIEILQRLLQKKKLIPAVTVGSDNWVQPAIQNTEQNWLKYFSLPYRTQWAGTFDESNCATRAAIELLEAILNYYLINNLFPDNVANFLKSQYCNDQGYVKLSIRYSSTVNGTTQSGNNVQVVWDSFATFGIVPEKVYPDPAAPFTWAQYYQPVPQKIVDFGKSSTTFFQIVWKVLWNGNFQAPDLATLRQTLVTSPVYFAGPLWITQNGVQQWNGKKNYEHARVIYNEDIYQEVLDSYQPNYLEKMSTSFPVPCAIKCAVNIV